MDFLEQGIRALRAEARLLWAALCDRRLFAALGVFAALLVLAAQTPLRYPIAVGLEEGYGSDRPMVAGFYDPELSPATGGDFRWTTERSLIRLPGMGQRPLQLNLRLLPVNQEVAARGPQTIEIWANGSRLGSLPIRPATGGSYKLLLPPPADGSGDQVIELRMATFKPTGDQRAIGTPVDAAIVTRGGGPALPAWGSTLGWLLVALLAWLALRRADVPARVAAGALLLGVLLASTAALLDPPRFAFGTGAALTALALGWLLMLLLQAASAGLLLAGVVVAVPALALRLLANTDLTSAVGVLLASMAAALLLAGALRPAVGAILRQLGLPLPPDARRWLLLMALLLLASRYGGKIYPDAMWGDIGFHSNRYMEVVGGRVLLLSRNRGVDFPYPPALYLIIAPFSLLGLDLRVLLQLGGALLDAASPFLMYLLAVRALAWRGLGAAREQHAGVLAAGIYCFTAATLMITWWNFSTHIFSQFAHLLLITALVLLWTGQGSGVRGQGSGDLDTQNSKLKTQNSKLITRPAALVALFFIQSLVYLGHFGFWINVSLLGGMGLAVLLVATLRGRSSWALFWRLLVVFVAAELFAVAFFYSAYTGLFIAQAQATASGGLNGLANRGPADRALLWKNLWDYGFRTHFGFFPVPLALCGLALLWWRRPRGVGAAGQHLLVIVLMVGTLIIALFFGALPFITGSTLSTRWLMFSAWLIALGAAVAVDLLWRSGRAGRWLVLAAGGYVLWVTAVIWLGALAWRIRPPEPF